MKIKLKEVRQDGVEGGNLKIVVDGFNAPVTGGDFIDLVHRGFYNNMEIQRADGFIVQTGDPGPPVRATSPVASHTSKPGLTLGSCGSNTSNRSEEEFILGWILYVQRQTPLVPPVGLQPTAPEPGPMADYCSGACQVGRQWHKR